MWVAVDGTPNYIQLYDGGGGLPAVLDETNSGKLLFFQPNNIALINNQIAGWIPETICVSCTSNKAGTSNPYESTIQIF